MLDFEFKIRSPLGTIQRTIKEQQRCRMCCHLKVPYFIIASLLVLVFLGLGWNSPQIINFYISERFRHFRVCKRTEKLSNKPGKDFPLYEVTLGAEIKSACSMAVWKLKKHKMYFFSHALHKSECLQASKISQFDRHFIFIKATAFQMMSMSSVGSFAGYSVKLK